MSKEIILARIRQRTDTLANWAEANPVLLDGELGIVRDRPDQYKVGDGVTPWNLLPFRGFDGNVEQSEGSNPHAVMSQKATTEALAGKAAKADVESFKQTTTQALNTKATRTEVETLSQTVATKAAQTDVTTLEKTVATKAAQTDVDSLRQQTTTSLTQLAQTVNAELETKASKTAVAELIETVVKLSREVSALSGKVDALIAGGGSTTPSNKIGSAVIGEAVIG